MKITLELMRCGLAIVGMDRPTNGIQGGIRWDPPSHILAKDFHLHIEKLLEISNIVLNLCNISALVMDECNRHPFHFNFRKMSFFPICIKLFKFIAILCMFDNIP